MLSARTFVYAHALRGQIPMGAFLLGSHMRMGLRAMGIGHWAFFELFIVIIYFHLLDFPTSGFSDFRPQTSH